MQLTVFYSCWKINQQMKLNLKKRNKSKFTDLKEKTDFVQRNCLNFCKCLTEFCKLSRAFLTFFC